MNDPDDNVITEPLAARELEILRLLAEGLTNREIARELFLSPETVKWYNKQLFSKLVASNRTQAVAIAREHGLLDQDGDSPILTPKPAPHNLPADLSSFVGREREINEVNALLETARLVTLTGPGGVGKTRLSLRAAALNAGQYAHGATFISLASITDPAHVPDAIARKLSVREQPGRPLAETIRGFLAEKQVLLLLDNFEHVLEAAPLAVELLSAAPQLTILATSREALKLSGEHEYQVPPLMVPVLALGGSASDLSAYDSVTLFVQRARAAVASFNLTEENAQSVAGICLRLDGLPLAIELAAAWIKLFNPQQLLERLESRLGLLTGGSRDLPARQRTLRDTIEWSYNLLLQVERQLFGQLAVFNGGASLGAIEAICSIEPEVDIVESLQSLLNKSLLYLGDDNGREPRFRMLDTVHEYARERLADSGEEEPMRRVHLEFFLKLAEAAEPHLSGSQQMSWINQLEMEHENLLAALEWGKTAEGIADSGLLLAGALGKFWGTRSYFYEGRDRLSAALSRPIAPGRMAARAKALRYAGLFAYMQGDYPGSRPLLEESESIHRELGPAGRRGLAGTLIALGDVETSLGDNAAAISMTSEALGIMRELKHAPGMARALWQLGACATRLGDYEQAGNYFTQALHILRPLGDRWHIAIALSGLAEVALRRGNYARATDLEEESLALRREIGETWGIAVSLGQFGWIALRRDDLRSAQELLAESLTLRREIGDAGGVAWCLEKLAEIALITGQRKSGAHQDDDFRRAAQLFGAAEALRAPVKSVIDLVDQPEHEQQMATLQAHLDEAAFAAAWNDGQALTMEEAYAYALTE